MGKVGKLLRIIVLVIVLYLVMKEYHEKCKTENLQSEEISLDRRDNCVNSTRTAR